MMVKRIFLSLFLSLCVAFPAFSQSKTISGGNDHGLIICAQGYLYTWGNNMSSIGTGPLLGIDPDSSTVSGDKVVYSPQRVKMDEGLTFNQVTAGSGAFNLALACNSLVYAWGDNQNKGCGQGPTSGNVVLYPSPVLKGETPGFNLDGTAGGDYLGGVTYVAASTNSGFAIMSDGRVVGWGSGQWNPNTGDAAGVPAYIKDADGNDLQNVVHITGGDDNCYFMIDADGDGAGELYAIGPYNGQTGTAAITHAVPVLKSSDDTPLTNIRMSAAGDGEGFAVTSDGYVWSWGNGGWQGATGQGGNSSKGDPKANKVVSGEYQAISGEEYLTDVVEVIGGRGHGAAITKEGYLVYWGGTDGINAGTTPDPEYTSTSGAYSPIFAFYCKDGTTDERGDTVKNAVSISRGDNFDFMINDKDEYYVWGKNDLGQCGTGDKTVTAYTCLTKLETIPCEPQDNCPTAFMLPQVKCPGEEIDLDCGFTVPIGKEDRYFITWSKDGTVLNTSSKTDAAAKRKLDIYNAASIAITDPGSYTVTLEYIGSNIPCDKCEPVSATVKVTDMEMPVDTVITVMNCVADPLKPAASDNVCFQFNVNDAFYDATKSTRWAVFSTEESKDTLTTLSLGGSGSVGKFCVSGSSIDAASVNDNSSLTSNDTTYNIWLEDVSSFKTYLYKDDAHTTLANSGSFQSYGLLIDAYATSALNSFQIGCKGYSGTSTVSVTPVIYKAAKNTNGYYVPGDVFWTGSAQSFDITSDAVNYLTVKCGVKVPGSVTRGARYILGMTFSGNCTLYNFPVTAQEQNSPSFVTPIIDTEEFGIYAMGATANSYTSSANSSNCLPYINVEFGKLTDYDCGRIKLTARYGCPPCNTPDGILAIQAADSTSVVEKVSLCKGESTTLSVSGIARAAVPTAVFDVLWFTDRAMTDASALQTNLKVTESSLPVAWTDLTPGVPTTYYMKVRDNEKPDASSCWVIDSIVVVADTVPVLSDITITPYCEDQLSAAELAAIAAQLTSFTGYDSKVTNEAGTALNALQLVADLSASKAGKHVYTAVITDKKTGCVSEPKDITVTVNAVPVKPTTTELSMLKENAVETVAPGATASTGNTLTWYTSTALTDGSLTAPNQDKNTAGTYYYYVSQKSDAGCVSDTATVTVVVNDAPKPVVRDTDLCLGSALTVSSMAKALSSDYELYWYTSATAEKGTGSTTAPDFSAAAPGVYTYYVSQKNTTTLAESEKSTITVTVYGVKEPTVILPETTYCKNSDAASLSTMVSLNQDKTTYYYADSLIWKNDVGVVISDLVPSTKVAASTTYNYTVSQAYTIPSSKEVCTGTAADVVVNVTALDKPTGDLTVSYLKTDAESNNNTFKSLTEQNPTVATAATGCTLFWYESDGTTLCNSGAGTAPAPAYNASMTEDVVYTYYVSQRDANGCESELDTVTVTISTAPMPGVKPLEFCDGETYSNALTATITLTGATDVASNYELVWYKSNPNDVVGADAKKALELTAAPVPNTSKVSTDISVVTEVTSYFVAQKNINTGAIGRASELKVTVYSRPVLKTKNPDPICEPATLNLGNTNLWYVSSNIPTLTYAYYDAAQKNQLSSTEIAESGVYYVKSFYSIPSTGVACEGELQEVNVDVHYIRSLSIEGNTTTCPGQTVDLTATTKGMNLPTTSSTYTWTCAGNGDNTVEIYPDSLYTTPALAGPAGTSYTYQVKVEVGACKGDYAATASTVISVGDGPVEGTISMTETDNTESVTNLSVSTAGVNFHSCGGAVTLDAANVVSSENDYTWSVDGVTVGTGSKLTVTPTSGTTVYHLAYTNNCMTGFDVNVSALPLAVTATNTAISICEGDNFSAELTVSCPENTYKMAWYKDGVEMINNTSSSLSFIPASSSQNGVYSYKVTNRGCSASGTLANGTALQVKPYIKFTVQNSYVARRDSQLSIPLTFTVPSGTDPSTIAWTEMGVAMGSANPLSLKVTANHNLTVTASDDNYCSASADVTVLVDARLQLSVELAEQMCAGDNQDLIIDTTGTGAFVYPTQKTLTVTEIVGSNQSTYSAGFTTDAQNRLHLKVTPSADATYIVDFTYRTSDPTDAQALQVTKKLTVLPAIQLVAPTGLSVCGDGSSELTVALVSATPSEVVVDWTEDPSINSGTKDVTSISVSPDFSASDNYSPYMTKTYTANGSYSICQTVSVPVSIKVYRPLTGDVYGKSLVCEGVASTIDASSYNAETYAWTSTDDDAANGLTTGVITVTPTSDENYYEVAMTRGDCKATDSWSLSVSSAPHITSIDSLYYNKVEVMTDGSLGTAPFQYNLDKATWASSSVFEGIAYGSHTAYVMDAAGCTDDTTFTLSAPNISIPTFISPNGDGENDVFTSPIIRDAFPNSTITIYDRWGKELISYKGSEGGWDGTYNGNAMPSTDYWYEIEIKEIHKTYTGHFTLLRQ